MLPEFALDFAEYLRSVHELRPSHLECVLLEAVYCLDESRECSGFQMPVIFVKKQLQYSYAWPACECACQLDINVKCLQSALAGLFRPLSLQG